MALLRDVSRERRLEVHRLISEGSDPRPTFFLMVAVSTLIAGFGLIMDSTSVVIGAMLVAPLMTPILGTALALVRGDPRLMGRALRAEVIGVAVALAASIGLGAAIPFFDVTAEMLSRTQPNLFDLTVALLAGLAGAWAMVDDRLSPMLPGVAISTAIVPPLANVGLCLSLGSYAGAGGSFLLFFTNFLSILLVSAAVFTWSGMGGNLGLPSPIAVTRRYGLVVVGFLVCGVLLGQELIEMIERRQLRWSVRAIMEEELAELRVSEIDRLFDRRVDGRLLVLARVDSPIVPMPRKMRSLERRLEAELGEPVELFLQCTLTREVSSSGSVNLVQTLDGFSRVSRRLTEDSALQAAEQVVREYLDDRFGFKLEGIRSFPWGGGLALYAEIAGIRRLRRVEIGELEARIQERVEGIPIRLGIRHENAELLTARGAARIEMSGRATLSPAEEEMRRSLMEQARELLGVMDYALTGTSVVLLDGAYHALFEVVGPRVFSHDEYEELKEELLRERDIRLELFVRTVPDAVVTAGGYTSLEELLATYGPRTRDEYDGETERLIREWR